MGYCFNLQQNTAIIGSRGSGKTTFLEQVLQSELNFREIVVLDSVAEERESLIKRCCAKYNRETYEIVHFTKPKDVKLTKKPLHLFDVSYWLERRNEYRECGSTDWVVAESLYKKILEYIFSSLTQQEFIGIMLLDEIKIPLSKMEKVTIAATYHNLEEARSCFPFADVWLLLSQDHSIKYYYDK
jgi:predicted ATPase